MGEEAKVSEEERQEDMRQLCSFTIEQIELGADKDAISKRLIELGRDADDVKVVGEMYDQIMETGEKELLTPRSIPLAVVGGALAALVCGVIWGLIVMGTGYEIGYVAWAVGAAAGFSVILFSGGKRGIPLQIIAVSASVVGIIIGKYLTFLHILTEIVAEEDGAEAASSLSILSGDVRHFFLESIVPMSHPMDVLWIVLAVVTAWRIPKGVGIKVAAVT